MNRRKLITLLGAAVGWPLEARAQQPDRAKRLGVLMNSAATDATYQSYLAAFTAALHQLGWIEGENIRVDVRWSAGDAALARIYAAQLIGLMPDVILASSTNNLKAIREATSTIPVVFVQVSDPVAQGFVANMTKPGGNITGFSMYEVAIGSKWLDLLKEVAPGLARVALMFNPETSPQSQFFMRSIEAAAPSLGVQSVAVPVRATADIEAAIESFAGAPNGGLILPTDSFILLRFRLIAELAARHRLPSISAQSQFAREGGLMSYGAEINMTNQRADKYALTINLKTARALGLTVPLTPNTCAHFARP